MDSNGPDTEAVGRNETFCTRLECFKHSKSPPDCQHFDPVHFAEMCPFHPCISAGSNLEWEYASIDYTTYQPPLNQSCAYWCLLCDARQSKQQDKQKRGTAINCNSNGRIKKFLRPRRGQTRSDEVVRCAARIRSAETEARPTVGGRRGGGGPPPLCSPSPCRGRSDDVTQFPFQ